LENALNATSGGKLHVRISDLPARPFLAISVLLIFSSFQASGQTATGEVNGTVTDLSGGAIAGATVKLSNVGTGVGDQTQTNSSGYYVFINV
jgi:Carboxypeptidase regulatory-like domain